MIKLYGSGQSRSFRALWALEESGLEFEYHHVNIGSEDGGGTRHPSYLAINSQGKVPTLVHGDLILTESGAILNYIASLASEKGLMPVDDPVARAKYDELCFFILSDLEQPLWTKGKHKFVLPREYRIPGIINTARWEFKRSLAALEHHMKDHSFVLGDTFTAADILLAQTVSWAERFELPLPQQFVDYRNELYKRPACERALTKAKMD